MPSIRAMRTLMLIIDMSADSEPAPSVLSVRSVIQPSHAKSTRQLVRLTPRIVHKVRRCLVERVFMYLTLFPVCSFPLISDVPAYGDISSAGLYAIYSRIKVHLSATT